MTIHDGEMKVIYEGREIVIPYKLFDMWGRISIKFNDKSGEHYSFYYSDTDHIWLRDIKNCPKWPTNFSQLIFRELDKVKMKHGVVK